MMSFAAHMPMSIGNIRRGIKGTRQFDDYAGPIRSLAESDEKDAVEVNCDWIVQLSGDIGNAIIYAAEQGQKPEEFNSESMEFIRKSTTAIIRNYRDKKKKSVNDDERWDYVMAELFCSLLKSKSKDWQASVDFIYKYFQYINHDKMYTGFLKNIVKILRGEIGSTPIRVFISNLNKCFQTINEVQANFVEYFKNNHLKYVGEAVHTERNVQLLGMVKTSYEERCIASSAVLDFINVFSYFNSYSIADTKKMGNGEEPLETSIGILLDHYVNKSRHLGFVRALKSLNYISNLMINKNDVEVPYKNILFGLIDARREELKEKIAKQKKKTIE